MIKLSWNATMKGGLLLTPALLLCIFFSVPTFLLAGEKILLADFRHRPPEMILENNQRKGPLKIILEEAAGAAGYKIVWRNAHFARSLTDLETGKIDIIPRMIKNPEREKFSLFLGPIGFQNKDILFLVRKGEENKINRYEDLAGLQIEIKRKTAYFPRFDKDSSLNKHENLDDLNMAKMFKRGRFDTMPVLDRSSLEAALTKIGMTNFSYANYRFKNTIGNYYGFSKKSSTQDAFQPLQRSLLHMVSSGKIEKIYKQFNLSPPSQTQ